MKLHIGIAAPIASVDVDELLTDGFDNLPNGYTGAPFTAVLIKEFLRQGHKVSAFTTDNSIYGKAEVIKACGPNFDFYICAERPRAWRMNGKRFGRAIDGFAYERKLLTKVMTKAQPDILHAHWTYEFALAAIETGLPHLITCHDAPWRVLQLNPYPYRAMRYLLARKVYRQGRHFSTVSDYMISQVQPYTSIPISVIPNPLAEYVLSSGSHRQWPATKRIGFVCNGWVAYKNPEPALLAFAKYRDTEPEAELHLYGHGFGSGEIAQSWCEQEGIAENMFFHGPVTHRQLIIQLNELDLLLHTSLEESFGVAVAEAMALGLPIVAGKFSGAVPWVTGYEVHNAAGCGAVLVDVRDPLAIAGALAEAFDSKYPERSASGYVRARQMFNPDSVCSAYMALYLQTLNPSANSISYVTGS